jgi:hypothetical protein
MVEPGAEGDIESDFLRFYRLAPSDLDDDGPRFIRLAERLPAYGGAVTARLRQSAPVGPVDPGLRAPAVTAGPRSPAEALFGTNVVRISDARTAAAMTRGSDMRVGYVNKSGVKEV